MTPTQMKKFISERGLSKEEFSAKVGITGRTLRNWQTRKTLSLFIVNAIKGAFGCK